MQCVEIPNSLMRSNNFILLYTSGNHYNKNSNNNNRHWSVYPCWLAFNTLTEDKNAKEN